MFRPQTTPTAEPGAKVYTRYTLFYDDQASTNNKRISNAVVFNFGDSNVDESQSDIQLAEPYSTNKQVGEPLNLQLDFFIPNEITTPWLTGADGTSSPLGNYQVDKDGKLSLVVPTSQLQPGNYAVAVRGNRSEITVRGNFSTTAAK